MAYVLPLRAPGGPRTWTVVDCAYKTVEPVEARPTAPARSYSSGSQARSRSSSPASPSTCKESAGIRSYK